MGGKKVGGTPVFIKGGRITKGAPSLVGRKIGALHEQAEGVSVRTANKQEREYKRAKHAKTAREFGVRADDLHGLAAEIHAHGNANVERTRKMMGEMRKTYPHFSTIAMRHANGNLDYTAIPHMDRAAKEYAAHADYAHLWPRNADDQTHAEHLYNIFAHGPGDGMSEDDAYGEALAYLRSQANEPVPF